MKVEIPKFPHIPARISRLSEFAYNLWWSWNTDARALFRRLDRTLWRNTGHNPVSMLREVPVDTLVTRAEDPVFLQLYDDVIARFDDYLSSTDTWFSQTYPDSQENQIAYFCAEFAVHNSLPIYSGGLGLLAGDTCKEASDLGIPMVAIGSLYPEGYFRQRMEADGTQTAVYERLNPETVPLLPVHHDDGRRFLVSVHVGNREIKVAVWLVQVGRVPIYLMDTDIEENAPWDRDVSMRLYIGDPQVRLRQEIILGIGGIRVLRDLGYNPSVFHLNEGHAAFATLELAREMVQAGKTFDQARQAVSACAVFTTHTPVKAGHDSFSFQMMEQFFDGYWQQLGITREEFLQVGQDQEGPSFSLTVLAMHMAGKTNGVSKKHGEVSRQMWQFLWPDRPVESVPILSITNGVHVPTWLAVELAPLLEQYLGANWWSSQDDPQLWQKIFEISDQELWWIHVRLKNKLLHFIRNRARRRWKEDGVSPGQMVALGSLLDPETLTIGFARRFATYKRANLILQDRERLKRILNNPWKPVQFIFAGKAHPADEPGKYVVKQVFEACSSHDLAGRIAFVEDYDKHVAQHLVQGVDLWLNNPRPPQEASGTSGQKAGLNGIPNCSVLDGWWCEAYNERNGWAIGGDADSDAATAETIYTLLEQQIVPLFYDRDERGVPPGWVKVMKEAIRSSAAAFSTRRMVKEYAERMYEGAFMVPLTHARGSVEIGERTEESHRGGSR